MSIYFAFKALRKNTLFGPATFVSPFSKELSIPNTPISDPKSEKKVSVRINQQWTPSFASLLTEQNL